MLTKFLCCHFLKGISKVPSFYESRNFIKKLKMVRYSVFVFSLLSFSNTCDKYDRRARRFLYKSVGNVETQSPVRTCILLLLTQIVF
jgi:hypothetical protein